MNIPCWPESRPLDLADKPLFDDLFRQTQPRISECTFAGLYLFRTAHQYRVSQYDDCVVILGTGYNKQAYAMMPTGLNAVTAAKALLEQGISLYGVEEKDIGRLHNNETYGTIEDRDSFDYLYLREELASLPGNRFHKKKNRINYFTSRHSFTVEKFTSLHHDGCLRLLQSLEQTIKNEAESFRLEQNAAREALLLAEKLELEGVVISVDGTVSAFALGERLNADTSVCHFEKGNHFLEGIMQLVNREFCSTLFNACMYVNREQDLGEPGLRNAKLSYHPVELIKKYRIVPRSHLSQL